MKSSCYFRKVAIHIVLGDMSWVGASSSELNSIKSFYFGIFLNSYINHYFKKNIYYTYSSGLKDNFNTKLRSNVTVSHLEKFSLHISSLSFAVIHVYLLQPILVNYHFQVLYQPCSQGLFLSLGAGKSPWERGWFCTGPKSLMIKISRLSSLK